MPRAALQRRSKTSRKSPAPAARVRIRVPATTANLGPGFDVLGLALDFYNEVDLTVAKAGKRALTIEVSGEGAETLPADGTNLVYRMVRQVFTLCKFYPAGVELRLTNRIPLARGMGSSSAAIIGGLVAANTLCGNKLTTQEILILAAEEEGHPDNVAPALLGGLVASSLDGEDVRWAAWKDAALFRNLRAVIAVPDFELSTERAREVLPQMVPREDAVFNASRVALFLTALKERRFDLLDLAMQDRLHQPYRRSLIPGWDAVAAAARDAGAYGVALSGAGPSILALTAPEKATRVGRAMKTAFERNKIKCRTLDLALSRSGTVVLNEGAGR